MSVLAIRNMTLTGGRTLIRRAVTQRSPSRDYNVGVTGGASGRLGPVIMDKLKELGMNPIATTSNPNSKTVQHLDISNQEAVGNFIRGNKIDLMLNSAGVSKGHYEFLETVNVHGTANIVRASKEIGIPVVNISSAAAKKEGVKQLGPKKAGYAYSKFMASRVAKAIGGDITMFYADALIGDTSTKNPTPALPDCALLQNVIRLEIAAEDSKVAVCQPTTYDAFATAVARAVKAKKDNPEEDTGLTEIFAGGDPVAVNELIKMANPLAPFTAIVRDMEDMKEFLQGFNDGIFQMEFVHLSKLPSQVFDNSKYRELLGDDYPGIDEIVEATRDCMSLSRSVSLAGRSVSTIKNNITIGMAKGLLKTAMKAKVSVDVTPLLELVFNRR